MLVIVSIMQLAARVCQVCAIDMILVGGIKTQISRKRSCCIESKKTSRERNVQSDPSQLQPCFKDQSHATIFIATLFTASTAVRALISASLLAFRALIFACAP